MVSEWKCILKHNGHEFVQATRASLTHRQQCEELEFKEQLQWFLAGTESPDKSDIAKIGIMLLHAGN